MTIPIPLAFHAEDQDEAERQAMDWADAEPRIIEARVIEARRTLGTTRWTVTVEARFAEEPQQAELGL